MLFQCERCETAYIEQPRALRCCAVWKAHVQYACATCKSLFDTEAEALSCAAIAISPLLKGWVYYQDIEYELGDSFILPVAHMRFYSIPVAETLGGRWVEETELKPKLARIVSVQAA
ncbi:MAG: hypothetical protein JWL87_28 [Candidatus Adlerbacteria bacterium]|nr:hypothetical protein [Candidatus Adlerbacteria bacterium]